MTSFRQVVAEVFERGLHYKRGSTELLDTDRFAGDLRDALKLAGYSIHRSGECVHPRTRRTDLGREMTPEEEQVLR